MQIHSYAPSFVACVLCALLAVTAHADTSEAWVITPPDESAWRHGDTLIEIIRVDSKTAKIRHSERVFANVAQSNGKVKASLPPCEIPEPGFWSEALPKIALDSLVPPLRFARPIAHGRRSKPSLFAEVVKGTSIEIAAHHISEHLLGERVASCAGARVSRVDARECSPKGLATFARNVGPNKHWYDCPNERDRPCVIRESAWTNLPRLSNLAIQGLDDLDDHPLTKMNMLYGSSFFGDAVFRNWSKDVQREGLIVFECQCVIGVGNCRVR
jgi:hypothetical protein